MTATHLTPDLLYVPAPTTQAEEATLACLVRDALRQDPPAWPTHLLATTGGQEYALTLALN